MKITEPGIYRGISEADYRSDPCPEPSLTQSLCKILIERSPQHAWTECPRLNPNYKPDDDTKFDIGNVAHRLILGRGKEIEIVQFDDWRKKEAQAARETAAAAGKIAVLDHQFRQSSDMVEAAWLQLRKHEDRDAFTEGAAEVMIAWQEGGVWFRSLVDWLHDDLRIVDDYKTTAKSVADHVIGHVAQSAGWETQAAFIERGLDILDPANAGRRLFRFIAQETDDPFAVNTMHMDNEWMTWGRKKVAAGVSKWVAAIKSNRWSAYSNRPVSPAYPAYSGKTWLERELSGEFENDTSLMMAG